MSNRILSTLRSNAGPLRDRDDRDLLPWRAASARASATSPALSRLELGSSSTTIRGIAEEGAGQRDALLLTARERRTIGGDECLVALRKGGDHFVHVGQHSRLIDFGVGRIVAHAGDVGLDRAGKSCTSCGR